VSLNRQQKAAKVEEVGALVASSASIIVAEYRGLEVARSPPAQAGPGIGRLPARVKNTLARRAVAGTPFEGLTEKLVGPLIYGISSDPVLCAKVLADFAKSNDKLALKAGAMPNFVMDTTRSRRWRRCPAATSCSPSCSARCRRRSRKFVRTLNEVPARFARTLAALRDEREKAPA
jgi:large subunit ribosomal protein L10